MPSQANKNVLYAVLALIGIACCVSLVWFLSQEPLREPESQAAGQPAENTAEEPATTAPT